MNAKAPSPSIPRRPEIQREFVLLHRRRRFASAAAKLAHELGVGAITVDLLCQRAGSARNTFYDDFENVEDCLRFGLADTAQRLFSPFLTGRAAGEWPAQIEAAIEGFYAEVAAEPALAELLLIHSFGVPLRPADPGIESGIEAFAELLRGGRQFAPRPVPALTEEYLARVVVAAASVALRAENTAALPAAAPHIALLAESAYLGSDRAIAARSQLA